jgi:hypothetical protein
LLEEIIGQEIHRALRGEVSDREALDRAQDLTDNVMHAAGYY